MQKRKFPSITKNIYVVFKDSLSAFDAAKQFYEIIWYENNFNRCYKTVTIAEDHNINFSELPHYLRLKIENGNQSNVFTYKKAYFPAKLLKAFDLLHCELKIDLMGHFLSPCN